MEEDEIVEEQEDDYEQSQDISDAQAEQYESVQPRSSREDNMFTWFRDIVKQNKPFRLSKVGNLNNAEIGEHVISMRDAMNLAHLGHLFNHHTFGNYFATRAKITSATSMSRKGWLVETSISQRKIRERNKNSSGTGEKQKWRLFSKKETQPQAEAAV